MGGLLVRAGAVASAAAHGRFSPPPSLLPPSPLVPVDLACPSASFPCCTRQEYGVKYTTGTFVQIYREMVQSFRHPHSLCKEIMVYGAL